MLYIAFFKVIENHKVEIVLCSATRGEQVLINNSRILGYIPKSLSEGVEGTFYKNYNLNESSYVDINGLRFFLVCH